MNNRAEADRFESMVLVHLGSAFALARWILGNDQTAEDVVQDALVSAYKSFSTLRSPYAKPWLLQIVRNRCLRHIEEKRRLSYEPLDESFQEDTSLRNESDPEGILLRKLDEEDIHDAIEALPEYMREIVIMREFEDMSYAEISQVIGSPIGTVMSRLSRARKALADNLREKLQESPL